MDDVKRLQTQVLKLTTTVRSQVSTHLGNRFFHVKQSLKKSLPCLEIELFVTMFDLSVRQ